MKELGHLVLKRGQYCYQTQGEPTPVSECSHLPPPVSDGGVVFVLWLINSSRDRSRLASNGTESFMAKEDVPLFLRSMGPFLRGWLAFVSSWLPHPFSIQHDSLRSRGWGKVLP